MINKTFELYEMNCSNVTFTSKTMISFTIQPSERTRLVELINEDKFVIELQKTDAFIVQSKI